MPDLVFKGTQLQASERYHFIYLHTSQGESGSKILMAFVISDLENKKKRQSHLLSLGLRSPVYTRNSYCFVLLASTMFSKFSNQQT